MCLFSWPAALAQWTAACPPPAHVVGFGCFCGHATAREVDLVGHVRVFVAANGIVFSVRNDVCVHCYPFVSLFSMVVKKKIRLCGLVHVSSECLCPSKLSQNSSISVMRNRT